MVSRLGRQEHPAASQEEGDEYNQEQLMAFLQRHSQQAESQPQQELEEKEEEEEDIAAEEEPDEEEEEDSLVSGQYHEGSDYINQSTSSSLQIPSSSLLRSWSYQENEVGDESDRATSTSPIHQNFPSQPYHQNTLQCSPSTTISSSIVSFYPSVFLPWP